METIDQAMATTSKADLTADKANIAGLAVKATELPATKAKVTGNLKVTRDRDSTEIGFSYLNLINSFT